MGGELDLDMTLAWIITHLPVETPTEIHGILYTRHADGTYSFRATQPFTLPLLYEKVNAPA